MNSNRPAKWINVTGSTLMVIALLVMAVQSGGAQSQEKTPANLQELKEKLQQLEEAMEELKGQINAAEERQKTSGAPGNVASSTNGGNAADNKPQKTSGGASNAIASDLAVAKSAAAGVEKTPENVVPQPVQSSKSESSF